MFIKLQYHFPERYWWYQWSRQTRKRQSYTKIWNARSRYLQKELHKNSWRPSSSAEDYYMKTWTLSGAFNIRKDCFYCGCVITEREWKTKKSCNVSHKKREVNKAVHQAIFDKKDDEWSIEVKERYACLCEDAVHHIECSSSFQSGNGNPKKNIMWRKCVSQNRWTYQFWLRWTVSYYNSGKNDGRKIEW